MMTDIDWKKIDFVFFVVILWLNFVNFFLSKCGRKGLFLDPKIYRSEFLFFSFYLGENNHHLIVNCILPFFEWKILFYQPHHHSMMMMMVKSKNGKRQRLVVVFGYFDKYVIDVFVVVVVKIHLSYQQQKKGKKSIEIMFGCVCVCVLCNNNINIGINEIFLFQKIQKKAFDWPLIACISWK